MTNFTSNAYMTLLKPLLQSFTLLNLHMREFCYQLDGDA